MQFTNVNCESIWFFFSLTLYLSLLFLGVNILANCFAQSSANFQCGKTHILFVFVCNCAIQYTPRLVEHIFAAIHRWNTEHTKYQAHISMIYYFFPHLFFYIILHSFEMSRFHSKNILLLLRAVVFSWKSFVVFVVRSCYHFASFIN